MTNIENAIWEIRDMIDYATGVAQAGESALRALNCGASADATDLLTSAQDGAKWMEVKRVWALRQLGKA